MTEIEKAEKLLFEENISQYQISKDTELSQSAISQFRSKSRNIRTASFSTIMKLAEYYDEIN